MRDLRKLQFSYERSKKIKIFFRTIFFPENLFSYWSINWILRLAKTLIIYECRSVNKFSDELHDFINELRIDRIRDPRTRTAPHQNFFEISEPHRTSTKNRKISHELAPTGARTKRFVDPWTVPHSLLFTRPSSPGAWIPIVAQCPRYYWTSINPSLLNDSPAAMNFSFASERSYVLWPLCGN